jgi:DNA-binding transcriptional ArsR family regulator
VLIETTVIAAVNSPRRREILRLVWDRELGAGEIHAAMPDVSFGAVSLQLRTLSNAGLVDCRREHRRRLYKARRASLGPMAASLEQMWNDALWQLKLQAELEQSRRGPRAASRRGRPRTRPRPPGARDLPAPDRRRRTEEG